MLDWRTVIDDAEKYNLYLNSREWGLKKAAVKRRCGGICERCKTHKMSQVHHLTYRRKYDEPLQTDLGLGFQVSTRSIYKLWLHAPGGRCRRPE